MQILVNTDNYIQGDERLVEVVEQTVSSALTRFAERITRVEVYLSDENSDKKIGEDDKRCVLEARVAGLQPISVREFGATVEQALDGATEKLVTTLDRQLGRLDDKKGRTSFSGDQMFTGENAGLDNAAEPIPDETL